MTPLQTWLCIFGTFAVLLGFVWVCARLFEWFEYRWLKAHALDEVNRQDKAREAMRRWQE